MNDPARSDRLTGIAAGIPLSVRSSNAPRVLALGLAIPRGTSAPDAVAT
jgi:hypothetical protein